jgi:hypothetical protein
MTPILLRGRIDIRPPSPTIGRREVEVIVVMTLIVLDAIALTKRPEDARCATWTMRVEVDRDEVEVHTLGHGTRITPCGIFVSQAPFRLEGHASDGSLKVLEQPGIVCFHHDPIVPRPHEPFTCKMCVSVTNLRYNWIMAQEDHRFLITKHEPDGRITLASSHPMSDDEIRQTIFYLGEVVSIEVKETSIGYAYTVEIRHHAG